MKRQSDITGKLVKIKTASAIFSKPKFWHSLDEGGPPFIYVNTSDLVLVLQETINFVKVIADDGTVGWIPNYCIEEIR